MNCAKRRAKAVLPFVGGRVYRRQLVEWLAKRRKRRRSIENDWLEPPGGGGWSNRREVLFNLREFVCEAYEEGVLTFRQFQKVVCATALLITKLGRLWEAEINETPFLADSCWMALPGNFPRIAPKTVNARTNGLE